MKVWNFRSNTKLRFRLWSSASSAIINRISDLSKKTSYVFMFCQNTALSKVITQAVVFLVTKTGKQNIYKGAFTVVHSSASCVNWDEQKVQNLHMNVLGTFHDCRFSHVKRFLLGYERRTKGIMLALIFRIHKNTIQHTKRVIVCAAN